MYSYETETGHCKGAFAIYQAKNGAIILQMGNSFTALSKQQVDDLNIDCFNLKDFNHDDFIKYYSL